jgi:c-di-GMP-binding flagellar brake protein YcgR
MVVEPKDIKYRDGKVQNKREYFRLKERIRINVQQIEKPESDQHIDDSTVKREEKVFEFYTEDISAGGIKFFSEVFYPENSYLEITLNFKKTDPPFKPIKVNAIVIRAHQLENSRFHNIAVFFDGISQRDRSHIESYILLRQRDMIAEKRIGSL